MLQTITPIRQLARLYAAVLRIGTGDKAVAARIDEQTNTLKTVAEAVGQMSTALGTAIRERHAPPAQQFELHERLGLRLLLDRKSMVDRVVIETGSWEPEQTGFMERLIREQLKRQPVTFLDLGSYWGLYSLLAMRAGAQTIHAFDADRHNFAQLQAQIFLNNASGIITPHFKAVSAAAGVVTFQDSRDISDSNRAGAGVTLRAPTRKTFDVDCVSIDDYLPLNDEFLIIKMDLEGHEPSALRGLIKTLARHKAILQVEIYGKHAEESRPIIEELGLRPFHRIDVDHYFANFAADDEAALGLTPSAPCPA